MPGVPDWSCGFDIQDAGDVEGLIVRDCQVVDVLFGRCWAVGCGQRSGTVPAELYQSGFYVQSARFVDCHTERSRKAGFLCKNQEVGGLALIDCSDMGSVYGLVVEYGGERMTVENFVSDGATRRALQMVGNLAEVGIAIVNYAGTGRPVLLGITERLEFVDATRHVSDLVRSRTWADEGSASPCCAVAPAGEALVSGVCSGRAISVTSQRR